MHAIAAFTAHESPGDGSATGHVSLHVQASVVGPVARQVQLVPEYGQFRPCEVQLAAAAGCVAGQVAHDHFDPGAPPPVHVHVSPPA